MALGFDYGYLASRRLLYFSPQVSQNNRVSCMTQRTFRNSRLSPATPGPYIQLSNPLNSDPQSDHQHFVSIMSGSYCVLLIVVTIDAAWTYYTYISLLARPHGFRSNDAKSRTVPYNIYLIPDSSSAKYLYCVAAFLRESYRLNLGMIGFRTLNLPQQ